MLSNKQRFPLLHIKSIQACEERWLLAGILAGMIAEKKSSKNGNKTIGKYTFYRVSQQNLACSPIIANTISLTDECATN